LPISNTASIETLLAPDPHGPERLRAEIASALAPLPSVRAISLFGSLAAGTADRWSDVDMLVACDDVETSQWTAAAAIRAAKSVLFYRMFSTAAQPSGRYWFDGESVFHKLDVSFITPEEYAEHFRAPSRLGYPVTLREIHRNDAPRGAMSHAAPYVCQITERETLIGTWIVYAENTIRATLRGQQPRRSLFEVSENLAQSLEGISRDACMAGGAIGGVAYPVLDIARHLAGSSRAR
jgi:predicted nucleotidyltransferase